jgi:hypothetical protein
MTKDNLLNKDIKMKTFTIHMYPIPKRETIC